MAELKGTPDTQGNNEWIPVRTLVLLRRRPECRRTMVEQNGESTPRDELYFSLDQGSAPKLQLFRMPAPRFPTCRCPHDPISEQWAQRTAQPGFSYKQRCALHLQTPQSRVVCRWTPPNKACHAAPNKLWPICKDVRPKEAGHFLAAASRVSGCTKGGSGKSFKDLARNSNGRSASFQLLVWIAGFVLRGSRTRGSNPKSSIKGYLR